MLSRESSRGRTSSRRASSDPGQAGEGHGDVPRPGGRHDDLGAVDGDAVDGVELQQRAGQRPRGAGPHQHAAGPVSHGVADGAVVAGRRQTSPQQHDLPLSQAFDLVEDVRADDHRPPLGAQLAEEGDEMSPLHGIGAVERLVEHEHGGAGHEGGRDLRALAHALAEPADPAVGHVGQAHGGEAGVRGAPVAHAVQPRHVAHELARGHPGGDRLVLGHQRQRLLDGPVPARVPIHDPDRSGVRSEETGHGPHERRLAGAVRPQEPGHAGAERAAELRERDLRTEPHRYVVDLDRRAGREGGVDDGLAGRRQRAARCPAPGSGGTGSRTPGPARGRRHRSPASRRRSRRSEDSPLRSRRGRSGPAGTEGGRAG